MEAPEPKSPRVRVAALLVLDGMIVLVRHRKGDQRYHLLPGGGLNWGEPLTDALIREVAEETGLACEPIRPILINDTIAPDGSRHVVNITFVCEGSGVPTGCPDDPRVEAVDLIDPDRLQSLDLRPPLATHLLDYLDHPDSWVTRYAGSIYAQAHE